MDEIQLNKLIEDTLTNSCDPKSYPKVCSFIKDSYGRKKVFNRVKDLVLNLGVSDVLTAIGQIENELNW